MPQTLLLIDDDHLARALYRRQFQAAGFRVLTAVNGREGIRIARQHRPDVILLDLAMPVMDGWHAIGHLHADPRTAGIPVAAISGETIDAPAVERLRELGFVHCLPKTTPVRTLIAIVRNLVDEQRAV